MKSEVLVIIPAHNEELSIRKAVGKLADTYPQYDYVVINDGSNDNTVGICKENGYNLVDMPVNLGLSGAFQAGMKYAFYNNYEYAVQYDGDGQHNPQYISTMHQMAKDGCCDIVIGSRFVSEKRIWSRRMVGSRILSACIFLTTGMRIQDPTSGMRLYNKKMIRRLAVQMNYGPEPDTIAYLMKCGAKVTECQVHMDERSAGESYLNLSNSIKYMVRMCSSILLVTWFRKKVL